MDEKQIPWWEMHGVNDGVGNGRSIHTSGVQAGKSALVHHWRAQHS